MLINKLKAIFDSFKEYLIEKEINEYNMYDKYPNINTLQPKINEIIENNDKCV